MRPGTGVWIALLAALLATGALAMKASAFTLSTVPVAFPLTALNGTDVTATTSGGTWRADGEGNNQPWHINVSSTEFTNAESKTIAVSNFEIRLLDASIVVVSGPPNPKPVSTQTSFIALSGTDLKIASATPAGGNNVYDLTPDFRLTVPAESYSGDYSATVTITIAAGP